MATRERLEKLLDNPNVKKMLDVIAQAEGVKHGYNTGFGNTVISDLSKHPNTSKGFTQTDGAKNTTTAAGRYQFLNKTWEGAAKKLGLKDFSPRSQDLAALYLIQGRGALRDVVKGDLTGAIGKLGKEWASLPSSPYKQNKRSDAEIQSFIGGTSRSDRARQRVSERREIAKPSLDNIYRAYSGGQMTDQEAQDYERDVQNGSIMLSRGQSLKKGKKSQEQQGTLLPQAVADAYFNNTMDADARADLERDRKSGLVRLPTPTNMQSELPDFDAQGVAQAQPQELTEVLQAPQQQSLGQNILGAGETALSVGTGALGGLAGATAGTFHGAAKALIDGEFGTQQGAQNIQNAASNVAEAMTYQPRTEAGQQQVQALGEFAEDTGLSALPPTLGGGLGTATATLGRASLPQANIAANNITQAAKPVVAQAVEAAKVPINAAQAGIGNLRNRISGGGNEQALSHMGAAEVPTSDVRQGLFNEFDVPSTAAQVSRDQTELADLYNTARKGGEAGKIVQNKLDEQQTALAGAIDNIIESKDAKTLNSEEIGADIKDVLNTQFKVETVKARKEYNKAIASEGADTKIDMSRSPNWTPEQLTRASENEINLNDKSAIDIVNDNLDLESTAFYRDAKRSALRLGIADEANDGRLIAKDPDNLPDVRAIEEWRKSLGKIAKVDDTRSLAELKSVIDSVLDNSGGDAFKKARKNFASFKSEWENKAIIKDLISKKSRANQGDQKIINERIIDRIISPSTSRKDLEFIGTLINKTEGGQSAWNDMQASVISRIRNEAYSGAHDSQGNSTLVFNRMEKAIKKLDGENRKLDTILGVKQAQKMRDASELARIIQTVPPNTGVNWSNTLTTMAAAFDAFVFGMTGMPVTVATALRFAMKYIGDKKDVAKARNLIKKYETPKKSEKTF